MFDELRSEARVAAMDLPGFGLADKPDTGYSVAGMGAAVADVIVRLGSTPVVLVGHSMGGVVASWIAINHPALVERLVLVDAAGLPGPILSRLDRLSAAAVGRVFGLGAALTATHDPTWVSESDSALNYQPTADDRFYAALESVIHEFDFTYLDSALSRITQPTLVIWGRYDNVTPIENAVRFTIEIPNADLVVVDGATHRPHVTHPGEVARAIVEFIGPARRASAR